MAQRYVDKLSDMLVSGAVNRRDIWPSREEAYKSLKARPAWKAWDDRVLKIFVVSVILCQQSVTPLTHRFRTMVCDPCPLWTIPIKRKV